MVLGINCVSFVAVINLITLGSRLRTIDALEITDPLCDDRQYEIVTDFSEEDCDEGFFYQPHARGTCLPGCYKQPDEEIYCSTDDDCPAGLYCPEPDNPLIPPACAIDEASCFKYRIDYDNNPYYGRKWSPTCLGDGTWAPKQCKGEKANGRCFCYDGKGKRLFGQEPSYTAKDMTCACSRRRAELESTVARDYITIHCDSMGNYEALQCDSGLCWCADSKSGKVTDTVVPVTAMNLLPCYTKEDVGEIYLRQCESEMYGRAKVAEKLLTHGTIYTNFEPLFCDADGSYGNLKIMGSEIYCNWRDNTLLSYHSTNNDSNIDGIDCNCARDQKMYQLQGIKPTLKCNPNGNYEPLQMQNGVYFCVDSDGFQVTKESSQTITCDSKTASAI